MSKQPKTFVGEVILITFDRFVKLHMGFNKMSFGEYLYGLRAEHQFSQKVVADKLGIDISLLSKIEHGERYVQSHMIPAIAELFELDFRILQIKYLSYKLIDEFGNEPHFYDTLKTIIK